MNRTPDQIRLEAAHHEASHAVAAYILGLPIDRMELVRPGETRAQGEDAGCVHLGGPEFITDVYEAQKHIVVYLAGEAGVRVAWALNVLADEQLGGEEVPEQEFDVNAALAIPNGSKPAERATYFGWYSRSHHPDEIHAEELARAFTSDPLEAAGLMGYLKARTSNMAKTERFQRLMGVLAGALLEHSHIEGPLAEHLLERADTLYAIESKEGETWQGRR